MKNIPPWVITDIASWAGVVALACILTIFAAVIMVGPQIARILAGCQ